MDKQHIKNLLDDIDAYIYNISKDLEEDDERIFWITELIKQIKGEINEQ